MRNATNHRFPAKATYVERINRAIDHAVGRLQEPLRLNDLAGAARLSPFHFHRVFQALVGETPAEFVKRLRLEKALGLMSTRRAPSLTKIAFACGFSSSSDFSRCFKQRFGVPPSAFDIAAWREKRGADVERTVAMYGARPQIDRLPPRHNPDAFKVKIRELPARTVAYIRVSKPYEGTAVIDAFRRLEAWAERHGFADGQWLGYQWDNPEITALEDCLYHIAVVAEGFTPEGEIGRFTFPPMQVAQIEIRGGIDLELRALQWIYGTWLPRSAWLPDDHPAFESYIGRPLAHGLEHFELHAQLPVRRA